MQQDKPLVANADMTFAAALVSKVFGPRKNLLEPLCALVDTYLDLMYPLCGCFLTEKGGSDPCRLATFQVPTSMSRDTASSSMTDFPRIAEFYYEPSERPVLYAVNVSRGIVSDQQDASKEILVSTLSGGDMSVSQLHLGRLTAYLDKQAGSLPVMPYKPGPDFSTLSFLLNSRAKKLAR